MSFRLEQGQGVGTYYGFLAQPPRHPPHTRFFLVSGIYGLGVEGLGLRSLLKVTLFQDDAGNAPAC